MAVKAISSPRRSVLAERTFTYVTTAFLVAYALFVLGLIWGAISFSDAASLTRALTSREVLFAIRLSLITATVTMIRCMVVGLPAAYALSRLQFRGKSIVDTLLDLPVVLPPIAAGVALLALFQTSLGGVAERLRMAFVFTPRGIVLAQFTVVCALGFRVLKSAFDGL
ncbi:MAG: hypothetical protein ACE5O2_12035, partial [Armatimonadota bacterium]